MSKVKLQVNIFKRHIHILLHSHTAHNNGSNDNGNGHKVKMILTMYYCLVVSSSVKWRRFDTIFINSLPWIIAGEL